MPAALLPNCRAASVTIIEGGRPSTVGSTSAAALAVDAAQYGAGDGPCLAAARRQQSVLIDDIGADERWPAFRDAAIANQLCSSLSIPLRVGPGADGCLNAYGDRAGAFTADDERLAGGFAARASIVVANALAYWAAFGAHRTSPLRWRAGP